MLGDRQNGVALFDKTIDEVFQAAAVHDAFNWRMNLQILQLPLFFRQLRLNRFKFQQLGLLLRQFAALPVNARPDPRPLGSLRQRDVLQLQIRIDHLH